jgi:hypothetical protein
MAEWGREDLEVVQGRDLEHTLSWVDQNGAPIVLTGRTFAARYLDGPADATGTTLTVDTAGFATGVMVIRATGATTLAWVGPGTWQLWETTGGKLNPRIVGFLTVRKW